MVVLNAVRGSCPLSPLAIVRCMARGYVSVCPYSQLRTAFVYINAVHICTHIGMVVETNGRIKRCAWWLALGMALFRSYLPPRSCVAWRANPLCLQRSRCTSLVGAAWTCPHAPRCVSHQVIESGTLENETNPPKPVSFVRYDGHCFFCRNQRPHKYIIETWKPPVELVEF